MAPAANAARPTGKSQVRSVPAVAARSRIRRG